eukprot:TRINITY_DN66920_c2_g3_i1.p1 TRINITY_DN66920_c2_g3~~TRINITY_DN66920_c2_g3_i1.p1  ORF type:complete len:183 (+),score=22.93 TRINITY_DN66920_c2_g3_i1:2-550(+)
MSEAVFEQCASYVWTRTMGRIRVVGRNTPEPVFEAVGLKDDTQMQTIYEQTPKALTPSLPHAFPADPSPFALSPSGYSFTSRMSIALGGFGSSELYMSGLPGGDVMLTREDLPIVDELALIEFNTAISLFTKGNFQQSAGMLQAYCAQHLDDVPAHMYLERVRQLLLSPPTEWDGAVTLQSK